MIRSWLLTIVLALLPGALVFRLPIFNRDRRAALPAEERFFWYVILSALWTLSGVLALALVNQYSLGRVAALTLAAAALTMLVYRGRLRYGSAAKGMSWTALLPLALVVFGAWRVLPPAEYIIGGRDPGTYINEGIQIAQRGSLVIRDPVVAAVPAELKPLFFAGSHDPNSESSRFMGFYVLDLDDAKIVGQFPHLFPASIAVMYDLFGLTGARMATPFWAVVALAGLYLAGARIFGRTAAIAGAVLLALHVIFLWFARYPNSEMPMLALLAATLLAFARAHQDDDAFFAPVAGILGVALIFLRVDALLVIAGLGLAAGLAWLCDGRRPRALWIATLAIGAVAGFVYLMGPVRAYFGLPVLYFTSQPPWMIVAGVAAVAVAVPLLMALRRRHAETLRATVPIAIAAILAAAAIYAYFLRVPDPNDAPFKIRLAEHDAYAFRTFVDFYLFWPATIATLAGFAIAGRRAFWRDPAFFLLFAAFSLVFFYKIRVVPEHFWMARRFVPVILPGALLLASVALVGRWRSTAEPWSPLSLARRAVGAVVVVGIGWQYAAAAAPVARHVEYAGIIPYVEQLANRFTSRDLLIVEGARVAGSDTHVFSLPLAYIYARNVLVLASEIPDKALLGRFLDVALKNYDRVFFLGGGGTSLLSRHILATPIADERVRVPEYAHTPWNVYPEGPRRKDFEFTVYQLARGEMTGGGFTLDVGYRDDLNTYRLYAKETTEGRTIRWTGPRSFVAVPGLAGHERELRLEMHDGGRPAGAPPAEVTVLFNDVPIATIAVASGFRTYVIPLPADLVQQVAAMDEPARITLEGSTWRPRDYVGNTDDRQLGVMLDAVTIQ